MPFGAWELVNLKSWRRRPLDQSLEVQHVGMSVRQLKRTPSCPNPCFPLSIKTRAFRQWRSTNSYNFYEVFHDELGLHVGMHSEVCPRRLGRAAIGPKCNPEHFFLIISAPRQLAYLVAICRWQKPARGHRARYTRTWLQSTVPGQQTWNPSRSKHWEERARH